MIKIIKRGTRDIRECDNCGCLFSFNEEDKELFLNKMNVQKFVKCPQCDKRVILYATREIPNQANCSNCKYRFTIENTRCNECGSENNFRFWETDEDD